ncbi:MmgE/PrpD family protein [Photorhabdus heterorhabditis]|uniref:MmgE/PrpD family protein n=1 Tax=Photorhabdus heterorhabditis TaxID=880156 RepID=UPI001BD26E6A|nr:MmgE/PrpD family protein [Photorhabdus heterorhabditis]MBS9440654.1 MmgE/PrpD family protein [Photorhabdus heterorhabditis]
MNLESKIVSYCDSLKYSSIDHNTREIGSHCLLDIIGVLLAGTRDPGVELLTKITEKWGGKPESRVVGRILALPAPATAMLNGAAARVLDFDDVGDSLGTHPSVAILPALLAIADSLDRPISREQFMTAYIAGMELSLRLSRARKETLLESGRYDLCKVIAATAASGMLYGLTGDRLHNALGIAYTSALGETQCMIDGASTVFYQQGLVASHAVKAVIFAEQGFTGAKQFLSGRWGYYSAFEPGSNLDSIIDELGTTFVLDQLIAFKPYPTCRPNTSAVALIKEMLNGQQIDINEIERIDVLTNQQIFDLVGSPVERKQVPQTVVEARFSLAYNIAAVLTTGDLFIDDFTENAIRRKDIIDLSRKIYLRSAAECEIPELGTHGKIKIIIQFKDATQLKGEVSYAKGNAKNPMTLEELIDKFKKCVVYSQNAYIHKNISAILDWILDRENHNPDYQMLANVLFPR